jgi:hypothetical protein
LARKTAREARVFSQRAIWLSLLAVIMSIIVPLFIAVQFTQTVRIENSQLENIIHSVRSLD